MADTLGVLNPLTYHGYVYDHDTGLYYLQSRYYDPEWGRFLNADAYVSTGQGLLGNNMFAYCNNNPVNSADPSGYSVSYLHQDFRLICHNATGNPLSALAELQLAAGSYGSEGQKIIDAMEAVNAYLTNTDPQAVLDSGVITFYKGVPYIKLPIGTDAFSFGGVFIGDEVGLRSDAIETVMHEYGHSVHFSQIGAANYFTYVAIPSMIGYWTDVKTVDYYSQPYEYIADVFGEVERYYNGSPYPYSSATEDWWVYWLITYL